MIPTKDEILDAADKFGFQVPFDGSNNFYNDDRFNGFIAGAEFVLSRLKQNEQPEAITEDSHFRKHDVGRSAAESESTTVKNDLSESSSETQAVGQNEQTDKVCQCSSVDRFTGWTEADGCYCCSCGKPVGCVRPG